MEFALPRGLRDILPEEAEAAEAVRSAFIDNCRLFDYRLMEPSSLELIETLEAKSGPAVRNEIYNFRDKSDREVGLRFDLTVGMTRFVTSRKELALPVRLGSYSSVWRYEEPQYGRYRWLYQWDAELFGPSNAEADAEIIEFSSLLFSKLGAQPRMSISSRRIIETFVRTKMQITDERRILDFLRGIDKLSKKAVTELASEYSRSFTKEEFSRVAKLAEIRGDANSVAASLEEVGVDADNLVAISDSLRSRGLKDFDLDLSIARGLDYYTDMVFEAYDRRDPNLGSLCGGGRYDSLPAVYGRPDLGATGVAGGVERAVMAFKLPPGQKERIFVAPVGERQLIVRQACAVAAELRRAGLPAQSEITGRSLRKILEAQSSVGTKAVVILGERELANQTARIKWMRTGEEREVKVPELVSALS